MTERLGALDASFLYFEDQTTPMHIGGIAVFQPPEGGFDYDRLVSLITERIALVPRYRQRILTVPAHLANPVWVDDDEFDVGFHVRRSALPKPGNDTQLLDLAGRLMSRRLDRDRPLWEIYLVEGLSGGRVAVITKTHHAMVDGRSAMEIGQVLLDREPEPRSTPAVEWTPKRPPGAVALVADAIAEYVRRPGQVLETVRAEVSDVRAGVRRIASAVGGLASAARVVARPAPSSPLNPDIGGQRRIGIARTPLPAYRQIRRAHRCTVNDVVLAVVTGALRTWLMSRGEVVRGDTTVRAMVPVSVRSAGRTTGNQISSVFVDLPVGEPSATVRIAQIAYTMQAHKDSGQSVAATALLGLGGFAPPTLHALGARVAGQLSRRVFNLVVTNVPGPQFPLYAAGARMTEVFPVVPLAAGQALSIGATSYDGGVYYGLNADRDAMGDVDVLAALLEESLDELLGLLP